ncbi:tyrosine--tRNA ligase [Patescibacteria group bacterium]|nr:tyrosine--tRNA ligase [Patescibacteria group bacterium]MCG2694830.1 tyrosine--tRNA ligase [Candidatus Parcubacteria bacterium]
MNIITDENKINEILERGVIADVLPTKKEFKEKLMSGERLRFYIGADPTAKALHLGHAQNLMLLENFRQLGHEVIFLIGDFTGMIGDPTDKSSARVRQTKEDVEENFKGWLEQTKNILSFDDKENPVQVKYNSEWLGKLNFTEVLDLASNFTVQQMLERDMFEKRFYGEYECGECGEWIPFKPNNNFLSSFDNKISHKCYSSVNFRNNFKIKKPQPIYLHEFLYPLMQGYDSVVLDVDIELCGTDQTFNALAGRTLLKKLKNKDKFVVVANLIQDEKTGQLMSKSNGTGVFLDLVADDLYGAIMSQPDGMLRPLFLGCTKLLLNEIEELMKLENPRDAKMRLAFEIIKIYHGEEKAKEAEENFKTQFQKKEIPENIEEFEIKEGEGILNVLVQIGFVSSNGEARRKIEEGAVKLSDPNAPHGQEEKIEDSTIVLEAGEKIIKLGRKIGKIIVK